jgi:hypothetical protein
MLNKMLDYIKFRNAKELFDQFLFQINTSHIIQINTRLVQVIYLLFIIVFNLYI